MAGPQSGDWERWVGEHVERSAAGLGFGEGLFVEWDEIVRIGWVVTHPLPTLDTDYLVVVDSRQRHFWTRTDDIQQTLAELIPPRFGDLAALPCRIGWQQLAGSDLMQNIVLWPSSERGRPLYGLSVPTGWRRLVHWFWDLGRLVPDA